MSRSWYPAALPTITNYQTALGTRIRKKSSGTIVGLGWSATTKDDRNFITAISLH